MPLGLTQSATAVGAGITASFLASGGTAPYTYAVLPGGAGGSIDSDGIYTAPAVVPTDPATQYDTIQVTDDDAATATAPILVGTPLLLFCEVIQREMGLSNGRVYLWDQKLNQPADSGLYIAVAVVNCKPFANVNRQSSSGTQSEQFVSMLALLDINIISRSAAARDRKEEIILALNSIYAQQQQEANSFYIAKLSPLAGFVNLSEVDGAAIPYRYKISVNIQYAYKKTSALQYFENFTDTIYTDT
jgi:GGDEF domain-containing protein